MQSSHAEKSPATNTVASHSGTSSHPYTALAADQPAAQQVPPAVRSQVANDVGRWNELGIESEAKMLGSVRSF